MIYYIRAIESDWPLVESLAIALGTAQRTEAGELVGQGWVYIGPVYKPTGETVSDPETGITVDLTAPVRDASGNPYIHANVVHDGSLRDLAESIAADNPAMIEALAMIPRFFVTDDNGQAVAPKNPARIIF
jgi:hypothetical protein